MKEIKTIALEETGLSVRAYNCLMRAGVKNLNDLERYSIQDLMRVRNLGQRALGEILVLCEEKGIQLGKEDEGK